LTRVFPRYSEVWSIFNFAWNSQNINFLLAQIALQHNMDLNQFTDCKVSQCWHVPISIL